MKHTRPLSELFSIFCVSLAASGAPTRVGDNLPIAIPSGIAPGPPGAVGSLYGSETLEGPDGNPVNQADSAIVTNHQLVPGQNEDQDLGLYLNLNSVPNPQPIRGTGGGTDPGPRMKR